MRLDLAAAVARLGGAAGLELREIGAGARGRCGGAVARSWATWCSGARTSGAAYHLAVVVDDARQGITHVVRGADLLAVTPLHRLLQALLGLPAPA